MARPKSTRDYKGSKWELEKIQMKSCKTRILKGLTKELIKISRDPQLEFDKRQLQYIKEHAKVTLTKDSLYNTQRLLVDGRYHDEYGWKGEFCYHPNKIDEEGFNGNLTIFSGFYHNPIGRVDNRYRCKRYPDWDYKKEFYDIIDNMKKARLASLAGDRAYCKFVKETGCMD